MRDDLKKALIECITIAKTVKNATQTGRHIQPVVEILARDMRAMGYEDVCTDAVGVTLPGYFRAAQKWDVTAYDDGALVAAIELKSQSGSFGKNGNNRVEEMLGSASDASYAKKNHYLDPYLIEPNFGYVMIVSKEPDSTKPVTVKDKSRYRLDTAFNGASYIDRYVVIGERLLSEHVYDAVWVVTVDLANGTVEEPDRALTYDKFLARLKGWLDVVRA